MGEIIAMVSGKGGTGKTTAAAYLGAALARRGEKTLLIDLNFRMDDLPVLLGAQNRVSYHLLDVIEGNCRIIQALIPCGNPSDLFLLPASRERELLQVPKKSFLKLTGLLKESFGHILIDAPSGFSDGLDYALAAADAAVIVSDFGRLSVRDSGMLLAHQGFQGVRKSVLLNRFDRKLLREEKTLSPEEAVAEIGEPLLGIIPESEALLLSAEEGSMTNDTRDPAYRSFERIAGRIDGEDIPIHLK